MEINGQEIRSPLLFKLIELNTDLTVKTLKQDSQREGYIAVFAPKFEKVNGLLDVLMKLQNGDELSEKELDFKHKFINM